jgi:aminoglycoside/choline kinase family phosphotransferase
VAVLSEELGSWLASCGFKPGSVEALAGDVSPRRYFRLESEEGSRAVLAVYPAGVEESCWRFLATTRLLVRRGLPVPAVLAADCGRGWMLLEDVGSETLYDRRARPWEELAPYLEAGISLAERIAALPLPDVEALAPPLGEGLLRRELQQTFEAFLLPRGLAGSDPLERRLLAAFDALCEALGALPVVPCHRDFMARNLVPQPARWRSRAARFGESTEPLSILDHQDLRLGPSCYDLASLLNDSLFPPPEIEERLLSRFLSSSTDRTAYHRAAAQRTLKAVGTYAAFASRGVPRHLPLIPPTLSRALSHLRHLPETAPLAPELERLWADACG